MSRNGREANTRSALRSWGQRRARHREALHTGSRCRRSGHIPARAGRARSPFSPGPPPPDENGAVGPPDLQQMLSVLIVRQWAETLTGEFDWGDWPLVRYCFSDAFLGELERQADLDTVAWVCAMVACGLADEFVEMDLQRRTHRSSGAGLVRHDCGAGLSLLDPIGTRRRLASRFLALAVGRH